MKNLLIGLFLILVGFPVYASGDYDSIVYTKDSNQALEGYDSVAYFEDDKPIIGADEWKTEYNEAVWFFSSEKNLNLFLGNPEKYAPAYGGYCAWAMSKGKPAPGRPDLWTIIGGRFYLNYNNSTQKKFLKDTEGNIRDADLQWPSVKAKLTEAGS